MPSENPPTPRLLRIRGASENNLAGVDLDLPHDRLVVFAGVSGSGKSSLAFDTIFRESERRFLSNLGGRAGRLAGRMRRPSVESIDGVRAAIAVDQNSHVSNSRSTVGTLSEVGDELRLLFARFGERSCPNCGEDVPATAPRNRPFPCPCGATVSAMHRSLFSFNTPEGACPDCRGLGEEEEVDPDRIVADPTKSLREGALVPTTPNGYIVYSQVTPESLDEVCRAHGFSIDTPWCELTDAMRDVIFYGSDRIEVAFGKHSLESRMKWSGIKAKPRELGYYRGIARVIGETLAKKRNANILRFVTSRRCRACDGSRLSPAARAPRLRGQGIDSFYRSTLTELPARLEASAVGDADPHAAAARELMTRIVERTHRLERLGLGHLALSRRTGTLSSGESRRLKLAVQLGSDLVGIQYVLDEPGAGLHPKEKEALLEVLGELRDRGNSVHVVEHDPMFEARADHRVEIGPEAGRQGGRLIFSGDPDDRRASDGARMVLREGVAPSASEFFELREVTTNHLQNLTVRFRRQAINLVCGLSGTGKTSLVEHSLVPWLQEKRESGLVFGAEAIERVLLVDQKPIGRNARSNPATWTGIFDPIRTLFSETEAARAAGLSKGDFSFNKKGGRCEACEGAGSETVGLMDMPSLNLTCSHCNGTRFDERVLSVRFADHDVRQVLESTVDEARVLFDGEEKITRVLDALQLLGLGYLQLGQPAPTLSGGEAQRLKLADAFARTGGEGTLFVLDEVSCGLHGRDVRVLGDALRALVDDGATIVAADHDLHLISQADWVTELGPEPGEGGGEVVFAGSPVELAADPASPTGAALRSAIASESRTERPREARNSCGGASAATRLEGVRTHNLAGVNVAFEAGKVTAITGVSGSGKTSLAFDTLAALGRARFAESFSPFLRREIRTQERAVLDHASGVRATVGIRSRDRARWSTATVGTVSGIDLGLRLLFSRGTAASGEELPASAFSFHNVLGACPRCEGKGEVQRCQLDLLVPDPNASVADGALAQTRGGKQLFDVGGRLDAVLRSAAAATGVDLTPPFGELSTSAREFIARGAGEREFDVHWEEARSKGEAAHAFTSPWIGVERSIELEYEKKRDRKVGPHLEALLTPRGCEACDGSRVNARARDRRLGPWTITDLRRLELAALASFLRAPESHFREAMDGRAAAILEEIQRSLEPVLERLIRLGLGHLTGDRSASSLSTGEARRLDLARQLTTGLTGACYVLDEPGLGLHASDKCALAEVMRELAGQGNTVVFVDHDPTLIREADHIVEIGPGAGVHGGHIVAQGDATELRSHPESRTGRALRPDPSLESPAAGRRSRKLELAGQIRGARAHHLRGLDLDVFYGEVLVVCGVSGSGKSTLLYDVFASSVEAGHAVGCDTVRAAEDAAVVRVDARPQGRGPASIVATTLDVMDRIRKNFARTDDAKRAGLKPGDFSFSGKTGGCPECKGAGVVGMALDFLPDAAAPCPACDGTRYRDAVRAVRWNGVSIDEFLATDVVSLGVRFDLPKKLAEACDQMTALGLGHLSWGRRSDRLSGGESQRLGIARQLLSAGRGRSRRTFVFDEPSRGLHPDDQRDLIRLFRRLTERGDAVVMTEHSLALIAAADRVVELGPGAGRDGGRVVFRGAPAELRREETATGRALAAGFDPGC